MKAFAVPALLILAGPAGAQSLVPGPNQPGRYEMQPVPGGIARLDTVTGDVSLCHVEDGTLRCRPSEDAPLSPQGDGRAAALPGRDPDAAEDDRTDAEIDRAIGRVKRVFRALGDIAREFDRKGDDAESRPDRT